MPYYIFDKKKAYTIRWIKYPESGIIMCSCGAGTPFTRLLVIPGQMIKCTECGKEWEIDYKRYNDVRKQW